MKPAIKFWAIIFAMMPAGLVILVALVLGGCASTAPTVQEVKVPVHVKCVNQVPVRPDYETPHLESTTTDGNKIIALARDWARSRGYEAELEAVVEGCK